MTEIPEQQANGDLLLNLWGAISLPSDEDVETWTPDQCDIDLQTLERDPALCFKSLMSHPNPRELPSLPSSLVTSHPRFLKRAWSRFDCNNFVLHNISSLEPKSGDYALGVFPLASRCFNHSCSPNSWSAFQLQGRHVWLEVRALETIAAGAEVRGRPAPPV
jgi:SET and MYND domain-containing protein